ncbi:MAG: hypothetical protein JWO86_5838 [Myxococcaceae bacterium]|nr:hypothetical protein [Myxococcaceae bacterium]
MTPITPTPPASPEDEWKEMAARGAVARRKAMIPKVVGLTAFTVAFCAIFFGVGGYLGAKEAKEQARLKEQGIERVLIKHTGSSSHRVSGREEAADAGLLLFVFGFAGGLFAGFLGFVSTGGKFSAEHVRGFKQMR